MGDNKSEPFDYKTHILVGCTADGKMNVICHWPHLPGQNDVELTIRLSKEGHTVFLLCTPTSILPVGNNGQQEHRSAVTLK
jgi:hypothetical protein